MKKNISTAFPFFLVTLACLTILIGGAELTKYYTRLNRQYYVYVYQIMIMIMKFLFPCGLGLLLFFRHHFREEAPLISRVIADGGATFTVVVYLLIISQKIFTFIFTQPEALLCFTLFLSSFVHSLLAWKRFRENSEF